MSCGLLSTTRSTSAATPADSVPSLLERWSSEKVPALHGASFAGYGCLSDFPFRRQKLCPPRDKFGAYDHCRPRDVSQINVLSLSVRPVAPRAPRAGLHRQPAGPMHRRAAVEIPLSFPRNRARMRDLERDSIIGNAPILNPKLPDVASWPGSSQRFILIAKWHAQRFRARTRTSRELVLRGRQFEPAMNRVIKSRASQRTVRRRSANMHCPARNPSQPCTYG